MGLDQYLTKRTYVKNWEHQKPEEHHEITVKKGGKPTGVKPERITNIVEEVGYWRKANAIHKWFIDNCAEGVDDCKEVEVTEDDLKTLLSLCKEVKEASKLVKGKVSNGYTYKGDKEVPILVDGKTIKDPAVAKRLLPTTAGFFFGGTDYDQHYLRDIEDTIKILTEALIDGGDFYYRASW